MRKVIVFASSEGTMEAYTEVEEQTNKWLEEHPQAKILKSHTNQCADANWTEFALTMFVELPEPTPEAIQLQKENTDLKYLLQSFNALLQMRQQMQHPTDEEVKNFNQLASDLFAQWAELHGPDFS